MLKHRIVTCLMFNDGVLFRTKKFQPDYRYTRSFVDLTLTDEVILLDITRNGPRQSYYDVLEEFSPTYLMTPTTVGGRIRTVDECKFLLSTYPVDRFVIGTAAYENPQLITQLAHKLGTQAVVVSIDIGADGNVWTSQGQRPTGIAPITYAKRAEAAGAGELFIQSIERDGSLRGYDTDSFAGISAGVGIPTVYAGGCGNWYDLVAGYHAGASGCALTNIFHHSQAGLASARQACLDARIAVRPFQ